MGNVVSVVVRRVLAGKIKSENIKIKKNNASNVTFLFTSLSFPMKILFRTVLNFLPIEQ